MLVYTYDLSTLMYICIVCIFIFLLTFFVFLLYSFNFIFFLLLNELMVFSLILLFLVFGFIFNDLTPQLFVLFILVVSSCEVVIGFSIIVDFFSRVKTVHVVKFYNTSA